MGRASEFTDELVEEAPQGAANVFEIMVWIGAAVLAGLVLLAIVAILLVLL